MMSPEELAKEIKRIERYPLTYEELPVDGGKPSKGTKKDMRLKENKPPMPVKPPPKKG